MGNAVSPPHAVKQEAEHQQNHILPRSREKNVAQKKNGQKITQKSYRTEYHRSSPCIRRCRIKKECRAAERLLTGTRDDITRQNQVT